ncbi:MAG TPA: AMP-binding protein [Acidimicrobiia bacterium]|nr:AMP-binding protein [Acidimicrobiia bacterium]
MPGWSFAATWEGIAREVPDRDALVCGDRHISWGAFEERSARLASHLWAEGVRPGDKVAIDATNRPEYLETFFAALRIGAAPVNVNYRYVADEVRYVLENSGARAIVHDPAFAAAAAEALAQIDGSVVDGSVVDGSVTSLETGSDYETALAAAERSGPWQDRAPDGDDLLLLYTGGTTGMPKGVMWRNDDLYRALWQMGRPNSEPPDPIDAARAGKRTGTCLPACPLMHGTGLFIALSTLSGGGTVVLVDRVGLDAALLWDEVVAHDVAVLTIVGDVFARPLLDELEGHPDRWDLGALRAITSSGVTWSPDVKAGLLAHVPHVTLIDSLGASEGLMSRTATRSDSDIRPARFSVNDRVAVLSEGTGAPVAPGSDEVGLVAVTGPIPLGYHGDEEKTAATFRVVDGVRYSIPGDYATVDADGAIRLLGRGSACINTGGEKVYPEEVELLLREHPGVADCLVVGVPDDRFGELVVALVVAGTGINGASFPDEIIEWCRGRLSGYKRPRHVVVLDTLDRSAAGKADYRRLREVARERVGG